MLEVTFLRSIRKESFERLPGGSGQGDEQSLQDASDIDNGTLLGDEEVHGRQDEEAMEHQTHYHCDGVKAQLLPHGRGVVHLKDLTGNQEHNPKREVPAEQPFSFLGELYLWDGSYRR